MNYLLKNQIEETASFLNPNFYKYLSYAWKFHSTKAPQLSAR